MKLLTKKMKEIAPVIEKSVDENYHDLNNALTLELSKLSEMEADLEHLAVQDVPIAAFQELESRSDAKLLSSINCRSNSVTLRRDWESKEG